MIIHPSASRGISKTSWLDSKHSFSFDKWYDPTRMGWGSLRVLNHDIIAPNKGFGMHPHRDMEIITIVLRGAVEHQDSIGSKGIVAAGEVQRMSAGSGVTHSERNASLTEPLELLQLWMVPREKGIAPSYDQRSIGIAHNTVIPLVTRDGSDGALRMSSDASVSRAVYDAGWNVTIRNERQLYLYVISGKLTVDGTEIASGDAVACAEKSIELQCVERCDVLLVDS